MTVAGALVAGSQPAQVVQKVKGIRHGRLGRSSNGIEAVTEDNSRLWGTGAPRAPGQKRVAAYGAGSTHVVAAPIISAISLPLTGPRVKP